MSKLFVPYTTIQPATKMVLMHYNYDPVRMTDSDSYLNFFKKRWEEGESFINIEHDVIFGRGAIEELERCPKGWCAFGTSESDSFDNGTTAPLALAKFSSWFIEEYPNLWKEKPVELKDYKNPTWQICDIWIQRYMEPKVCHQHYPSIVNANPVKNVVKVIS